VFDCSGGVNPSRIGNVSDLSFLPHFVVFGGYLLSARTWQGFVVYKTNITFVPTPSSTNPFNLSIVTIVLTSSIVFFGVFVYRKQIFRKKH
jgi:hypothetical protein